MFLQLSSMSDIIGEACILQSASALHLSTCRFGDVHKESPTLHRHLDGKEGTLKTSWKGLGDPKTSWATLWTDSWTG